MNLSQPYQRIVRPFANSNNYVRTISNCYIIDDSYAKDRTILSRAYQLIERDLKNIFDYIEPHDDNLNTYSHRNYELFLRASTEFEANCKAILKANGYSKPGNFNITDYFKINKASKLHEYKVILNIWHPQKKILQPFSTWNGLTYIPLHWYQAYNNVKHDRNINFKNASFSNLLESVAGLLVILFSQFFIFTLNPYQIINECSTTEENGYYVDNSLFAVVSPNSWLEAEKYDFDWNSIKSNSNPFKQYPF